MSYQAVLRKAIDADDVVLLSSSLQAKDYLDVPINVGSGLVNGYEYSSPNLVQYVILQDKPICLSYLMQTSPEFHGTSTQKTQQYYLTKQRYNLLHLAIAAFAHKSIGVLLDTVHSKPDMINETTADGCTPLHLAAQMNLATVVSKLISYGGNLFMSDKFGYTPLHYAIQYSYRSAELICQYMYGNYPRAFFSLLHRPVGTINDLIDFAASSKINDIHTTIRYFDSVLTGSPGPNEPEMSLIDLKSSYLQEDDEIRQANNTNNSAPTNQTSGVKAPKLAPTVSFDEKAKETGICSMRCCIKYNRLQKCSICGKSFCPLHIGDHSHSRIMFFG